MLNPSIQQYPFKTLRTIDGKQYVEISEVNEMLDNLEKVGPVLQQAAEAAKQLRDAFSGAKKETSNLLLELDRSRVC